VPGDLVELSVEGVSFRYPASSSWALRGVDVRVRTGEVVALVGANGSGKTTLAKVMADLFEPAGGVVRWNGEDVRRFDPRAVRERIAVIFQDFERYLFTAGENVTLGRVEAAGDRDRLEQAARRAGIAEAIERLPHGYDTLLGPEFQGGTDFSGGQWQRLALARAFFRDAQLLILDEPSSALDPEAEAALFSRVRDLCDGRAVVVISHRFSTVTSADRIVVLDEGRVIESGSHRELLALDGTYARLFRLQAQQYLDDAAPREP
jgi:ATP-binding cassette subfamily B protein